MQGPPSAKRPRPWHAGYGLIETGDGVLQASKKQFERVTEDSASAPMGMCAEMHTRRAGANDDREGINDSSAPLVGASILGLQGRVTVGLTLTNRTYCNLSEMPKNWKPDGYRCTRDWRVIPDEMDSFSLDGFKMYFDEDGEVIDDPYLPSEEAYRAAMAKVRHFPSPKRERDESSCGEEPEEEPEEEQPEDEQPGVREDEPPALKCFLCGIQFPPYYHSQCCGPCLRRPPK